MVLARPWIWTTKTRSRRRRFDLLVPYHQRVVLRGYYVGYRVLTFECASKQTPLTLRGPTNRWTGAAGACFALSLVRRSLDEYAPPGQLRRWAAIFDANEISSVHHVLISGLSAVARATEERHSIMRYQRKHKDRWRHSEVICA